MMRSMGALDGEGVLDAHVMACAFRDVERLRSQCLVIVERPGDPAIDGGLPPACSTGTDPYLPREAPVRHFAIEGRARQAGPIEHGLQAEDAVWFDHGILPMAQQERWSPGIQKAKSFRLRKPILVPSWRSEERQADGGVTAPERGAMRTSARQ